MQKEKRLCNWQNSLACSGWGPFITPASMRKYQGRCSEKSRKSDVCTGRPKAAVRVATQYMHPPPSWESSHLFTRWHLFRHVGYLRHQQQVDLWPFDLESGVRVTYVWRTWATICANISLPRPLCSGVRPDVRDRQTDVMQTSDRPLNASALWGCMEA